MFSLKKLLPLTGLTLLLWAGCTHSTLTNLTSSQAPRTTNGLYLIELAFDSNMHALRAGSIKPYVLIGFDVYEMHKTLGIKNRFEARIPVPATKDSVNYQFKVDYQYNRVGVPPSDESQMSRNFTLRIVDQ